MTIRNFEWTTSNFVEHWFYDNDFDSLMDGFSDYIEDRNLDVDELPFPPSDTTDGLSFYKNYFNDRFGPKNYSYKESHLFKKIDELYSECVTTMWEMDVDWSDTLCDFFSEPKHRLMTKICDHLFEGGVQ